MISCYAGYDKVVDFRVVEMFLDNCLLTRKLGVNEFLKIKEICLKYIIKKFT
jgi:hypothetical protein